MTPSRSCLACFSAGQLPIFCGVVSTTAGAAGCVCLGLGGCRFPGEEVYTDRNPISKTPAGNDNSQRVFIPDFMRQRARCRASIPQNGGAYKCKCACERGRRVNRTPQSRTGWNPREERGIWEVRESGNPPSHLFSSLPPPIRCTGGGSESSPVSSSALVASRHPRGREKKKGCGGAKCLACLTPRAESLLEALPLVQIRDRNPRFGPLPPPMTNVRRPSPPIGFCRLGCQCAAALSRCASCAQRRRSVAVELTAGIGVMRSRLVVGSFHCSWLKIRPRAPFRDVTYPRFHATTLVLGQVVVESRTQQDRHRLHVLFNCI